MERPLIDLPNTRHIHMVGIGGIGMSALADILLDYGIKISGSDLKDNRLIGKLRKKRCHVDIGHNSIYGKPDFIVRSFGVKDNNSEVMDARAKGVPVIERSELLKAVMDSKARSIAVTGTHGKTTTTGMISYILDKARYSPTVLIGGEFDHFKGNSQSGKNDIIVAETDESDGFLSKITPGYAVITNVEKEHMEHYKNMDNLLSTFNAFIQNIQKGGGVLFYNKDDGNLKNMVKSFHGKSISFGLGKGCNYNAVSIKQKGLSIEFICCYNRKKRGKVKLNVPGLHNVYNALAAIAVSREMGLDFDRIIPIIRGFHGVKRRFEIKADKNGIMVVEDYAHHPTEIKMVINIARNLKRKRIIAVFQPHRYTRTMYLEKEFAGAFGGVDELVLADIYAASENSIEGVSIKNIYEGVKKKGINKIGVMAKNTIPGYLRDNAKKGDLILIMGAGDINEIVPEVINGITKNRGK